MATLYFDLFHILLTGVYGLHLYLNKKHVNILIIFFFVVFSSLLCRTEDSMCMYVGVEIFITRFPS
jgi:hypothetical protein